MPTDQNDGTDSGRFAGEIEPVMEKRPVASEHRAYLSLLRVLASFTVVQIHVAAIFVLKNRDYDSFSWMLANTLDASARWCLPIFVMISGALLLGRESSAPPSTVFRRRLSRIFPSLVFWSAIYVTYRFWLINRMPTVDELLRSTVMGRPFYHLWYLYMLPGLYAATPLLDGYLRATPTRLRQTAVVVMLVAVCLHTMAGVWLNARSTPTVFSLFVPWIGYYLLGYELDRLPARISGRLLFLISLGAGVVGTVGSWLLVGAFGTGVRGLALYSSMSPTVILMSGTVFLLARAYTDRFPYRMLRLMEVIAPITLGIYLIHPLVLDRLQRIPGLHVDPRSALDLVALLGATYVLSFVASYVFTRIPLLRKVV